jgi:hypothetical protein
LVRVVPEAQQLLLVRTVLIRSLVQLPQH